MEEKQLCEIFQNIGEIKAGVAGLNCKFDEHVKSHVDVETRLRRVERYQIRQIGIFSGISACVSIIVVWIKQTFLSK